MIHKNQKNIKWIIFYLSTICLIVFFFNNIQIPKVKQASEAAVRKELDQAAIPKATVAVVGSDQGIGKYTELSDQIISERVKMVEIPEKFLASGAIQDLGSLKGKITKEDMRLGEQIVEGALSTDDKWYGEYERLKEYQISSIVADEVKTGNIVDLVVNYGNGDYDIVAPKIKVIKLITKKKEEAAAATQEKTDAPYTLIFAVDEVQYRDLELAKKMGVLETRLYLDENQPPSKKTFDYNTAVSKYNIQKVNDKSGGQESAKAEANSPKEN